MANIKSAMKRAQIAELRTARNKSVKTGIKTNIKKFESALESKDSEAALTAYKTAVKSLDKGVAKGVLHKNSAARKKSSLARKLNAM
ncbi:30S ribosomal protein S20 [Alkalibacter mobilis]|uniref:30S ribosomal protein S20 n=1 Tax=Alkalibacter mobilis TaxID=2787712 RepID=UPI0018A114C5|nr:30S ribosomal protein S20 [Alkalibacter mobilis]MBF7096568.1 30S ribosomal protein S20 [Alkalibacter mobilis]